MLSIAIILVLLTSSITFCQNQTQEMVDIPDLITTPRVALLEITNYVNFRELIFQLMSIQQEPSIAGVIFVIDNYGGAVGNFSVIHDMIKALSVEKPTLALIVGQALSGGYLVASATNHIIAHSMCEIGSIGVLMEITKYHNARCKDDALHADMDKEILSAGEYKTLTHPFSQALNPKQRNYMNTNLERLYGQFKQLVANNRNLELDQSHVWAEGKIFDATTALNLGLIDAVGTIFTSKKIILDLIQSKDQKYAHAQTIDLLMNQTQEATPTYRSYHCDWFSE